MHEISVDAWIERLSSSDPNTRIGAAHTVIIYNFIDKRAVEPLITALGDSVADVRSGAAISLGLLLDMSAVEPLIAALDDEDLTVRAVAAEALGTLRSKRAVDPLVTLYQNAAEIRSPILLALGNIGDARVTPIIIKASYDNDPWIRRASAIALGNFRDIQSLKRLQELQSDPDPEVAEEATNTLGDQDENAIPH
jgi:HEAT repeat protein